MRRFSRRRWLKGSASVAATAFALGGCTSTSDSSGASNARVVIIGGGIGGASCARAVRAGNPDLSVTLVEANPTYTACPLSNLVLTTDRPIGVQQFGYADLGKADIEVILSRATVVDPVAHSVELANGEQLTYDRLVISPGIDLRSDALPGYTEAAYDRMPHAWKAGAQTLLLKRQLDSMSDGGLVVMSVPDNPYRCPPGPYERASLIAHYLKTHKPRSKLLVLDAKDRFSKQPLFMAAWRELYGDLLEWQGRSSGAEVISVVPEEMRLDTDFDSVTADVANVIPPQQAGAIAAVAGVADASGWCPINPLTFESSLQPDIHVIGDAAIANAMPKSAFAANVQAKLCAIQINRLLAGEDPLGTTLINTCYSLVNPDYGISVAGVYRPDSSGWLEVDGAGGTSPMDTDPGVRALEAGYARDWYGAMTAQVFGA
jgi:NADPH-dependent 2,4-dienoyl-CoA reductase/sulfur reductase-like enzyme